MKTFILFLAFLINATAWVTPRVFTGNSKMKFRNSPTSLKMSIAVFGATGGTGGEVAYQAMQRGEAVTCLVRDKSRLVVPVCSGGDSAGTALEGVANVVEGTVTSQDDVNKVFEGQDVTGVVIALGGKSKDVGPTMLQDGTTCIINACKQFGVKRISVVTSIGAGDSESQAPFFFQSTHVHGDEKHFH